MASAASKAPVQSNRCGFQVRKRSTTPCTVIMASAVDDAGYLATYTDVRNAGINPLDHYHQFGWHEGRDPSVNFDTNSYLAANPDVAAAGVDPLAHFLRFGIHEGRSPLADGVWA
jgi:hypothetical protein